MKPSFGPGKREFHLAGKTENLEEGIDPPRASSAAAGEHRLDLLAVALGLIRGDWRIADSTNTERRAIWSGLPLNGVRVRDWEKRPHLVGGQ